MGKARGRKLCGLFQPGGYEMEISALVQAQRDFFASGATRPVSFRAEALKKLQKALRDNEAALEAALYSDFRKPAAEVFLTEIGTVSMELSFQISHLRRFARPRRAPAAIGQLPGRAFVSPEPYGVALIMAPWNYPVQLCLDPLAGALAAGNCAVVKPSAYAPETSRAIKNMLASVFDPAYVAVIEGGREENAALLDEQFDYIFFTGSRAVGKLVMEKAARHLTPVTLELGGKSPVIVDGTADVAASARRVAFGKVLNAGQTCVAPDYAFVQASVLDGFVQAYRAALREFFPDGFGRMPVIVNEKHYARVKALLKDGRAAVGGGFDDETRFIEPTLLLDVPPDAPVLREEIFGPILPVLPYRNLEECIAYIRAREKPLALYLFTKDRKTVRRVLDTCSFGGGCVNDTILHLASSSLPFGGVGASGLGSYHGRKSFDTFSHERAVLAKPFRFDIPLRYQPYTDGKLNWMRRIMK
jgi:aldehyde dehydrogenase (NAD+)